MVSVAFRDDRLVVASPGLFFGGVTADNIALHEPRHRNKALARLLMLYNMVDRAGMGVLRMGIGSLMYGRKFPSFREAFDSVEVTMEARYLNPPVLVLALDNREKYGLPEFFTLNAVAPTGHVSVRDLEARLKNVVERPWQAIKSAVDAIESVELCGDSKGVYIRVVKDWNRFFKVRQRLRTYSGSPKYVSLYDHLKEFGSANNSDLTESFGYSHASQTSKFLRTTEFVRREGAGRASKWLLV